MEAVVFDKKSGTLTYTNEAELPVLESENDVLIRVIYSGICGTDLHIIEVSVYYEIVFCYY
jgi:threonine dehydrogenase-like Zn-dependent dehydrogenase